MTTERDGMLSGSTRSPPRLEKIPQQRCRLALADPAIDLRHVVAGRRSKEPPARFYRAALGIGRAVIQPPYPRERDRGGAHRARLQRHVEVAIDQPLAADDFSGEPDGENFGMRGGIPLGQGAVSGRGDDLIVAHDHASDRHFAGFSCCFGRFQRQIHERRCGHASSLRENSVTTSAFSKSGTRFCVRMRCEANSARIFVMSACPRSTWLPIHLYPKRDLSCPATKIKTTIRAAGVIGPSAARAAPVQPGDLRKSSPSAVLRGRISRVSAMATSAPMPASPIAPDHLARSPIRARANHTLANAGIMRMLRVAMMETLRAPHGSKATTVPGRIGRLPIVRRVATAAKPLRHLALRTGNSATRNFLTTRRTVVRAKSLGRLVVSQNRGRSATPARLITSVAIRGPPATAQASSKSEVLTNRNSTSRVMTNRGRTAAVNVRGFLARARIVPKVTVRFASGRSSIVPARIVRNSSVRAKAATPGRSIRAASRDRLTATRIGRAATTKTTARSLQNAR